MLTQDRLKELLRYDSDTGVFTWRVTSGNGIAIGDKAGFTRPNGAIYINLRGRRYMAHRLAWLYVHGEWPEHDIDHIDHDPSNNRIVNLRSVTHQENGKNQSLSKLNKSGVSGVSFHKQTGKWTAQIFNNRKRIYLGVFVDKFIAICARKSAENKYGYHANHGR